MKRFILSMSILLVVFSGNVHVSIAQETTKKDTSKNETPIKKTPIKKKPIKKAAIKESTKKYLSNLGNSSKQMD